MIEVNGILYRCVNLSTNMTLFQETIAYNFDHFSSLEIPNK
jgi:hypothetical protein